MFIIIAALKERRKWRATPFNFCPSIYYSIQFSPISIACSLISPCSFPVSTISPVIRHEERCVVRVSWPWWLFGFYVLSFYFFLLRVFLFLLFLYFFKFMMNIFSYPPLQCVRLGEPTSRSSQVRARQLARSIMSLRTHTHTHRCVYVWINRQPRVRLMGGTVHDGRWKRDSNKQFNAPRLFSLPLINIGIFMPNNLAGTPTVIC